MTRRQQESLKNVLFVLAVVAFCAGVSIVLAIWGDS